MRYQYTAISLACITLLSACGGGGGGSGESGNKLQSLDFPYPKPRNLFDAPAPLVATSSSGQAITFTSDTPSICAVTDGKLVPVKPGECLVTATVAGDSTYAPATARQLFMVLKQPQIINFESPGTQDIDLPPAPLAGTSNSGLPLVYTSSTPAVCTVSGATLTLVSKGQCQITATQPGNDSYAEAAIPVPVEFKVADEVPPVLTFLTGYASTSMSKEGAAVGAYSGSNMDGWNCSDPNWCLTSISADGKSFTRRYLIQPKDPKHPNNDGWMGGYSGMEFMVPGVTVSSTENTTAGLQVGKQATIKFHLTQNAEWFGTTNNKVKILLKLGHYIKKADGGNCNVILRSIATPVNRSGHMEVKLDTFTEFEETCGAAGLNAAAELLAHPIVQLKIDANQVNTTVLSTPEPNPSYLTEMTVTGRISIQ